MNRIRTSNVAGCALVYFSAFRRDRTQRYGKHKPEPPADSLTVVAQLPLPRASVSQIFQQGRSASSSCTCFRGIK
jgi:hypothetical protein